MAFRTQKISQMTPKGADLEATDLIEVSTIESGSYVTRSITGQELIDAIPLPPSGLTVGTTPISSGNVGRVLFEGAGNVVQESIDFAFNTANSNLLLGRNASNTSALLFQYPRMAGINGVIWAETSASSPYGYIALDRGSGEMRMFTGTTYFPTFYSSNAERMRIATTGNVLINTTTDSGYKLDVNGDTKTLGLLTAYGISTNLSDMAIYNTTNNTGYIRFITQTASAQAERMRIFNTGNVGINTTTDAGYKLDVNGTARFTGNIDLTTNFQIIGKGVNDAIRFATGEVRVAVSTSTGFFSIYTPSSNTTLFRVMTNGNALIGTTTEEASSKLTIESTTQGFLPPRMTTTQRNAIASPAAGLVVYDNTDNKHYGYNGTTWNAFY